MAELTEVKRKQKVGFITRMKIKFFPHKAQLITMFYRNDTARTFFLTTSATSFKHNGKTYLIRREDARFDLSRNESHLYYYEQSVMPIGREIQFNPDSVGIKKDDSWFSVTPSNIAPYIRMEVVTALVSSDNQKWIRIAVICGVVTLILSLVSTLILLNNLRTTV